MSNQDICWRSQRYPLNTPVSHFEVQYMHLGCGSYTCCTLLLQWMSNVPYSKRNTNGNIRCERTAQYAHATSRHVMARKRMLCAGHDILGADNALNVRLWKPWTNPNGTGRSTHTQPNDEPASRPSPHTSPTGCSSYQAKIFERRNGFPMPVATAARVLADTLLGQRGRRLSVGTMVMGYDRGRGGGGDGREGQLFYVDSEGARVKGRYFSVG